MKKYISPQFAKISLSAVDIIATSSDPYEMVEEGWADAIKKLRNPAQ